MEDVVHAEHPSRRNARRAVALAVMNGECDSDDRDHTHDEEYDRHSTGDDTHSPMLGTCAAHPEVAQDHSPDARILHLLERESVRFEERSRGDAHVRP